MSSSQGRFGVDWGWLIAATLLAIAGGACSEEPAGTAGNEELIQQIQSELASADRSDHGEMNRRKHVKPVVTCVRKLRHDVYEAHFGYTNSSSGSVSIPVGFFNRFLPPPIKVGQPTIFAPGSQADVVRVTFPAHRASIWVLGEHFAVATRSSEACPVGGTGGQGAGGMGAGGSAGNADGGGSCTPPDSCDDHDPCTIDTIDAPTCTCQHSAASDGAACDDGDVCSAGDACQAGICVAPTILPPQQCGLGCSQCVSGVAPGDPDLCDATPDGCFNCNPQISGCDMFAGTPDDMALCENLYACLVAPTHPGTSVAGPCTIQGDPTACWCGTNTTCTSGDVPGNGPCAQQIFAAARSTDPATINQLFVDPTVPIGRAVNLAICVSDFCASECGIRQ